MGIDIDRERFSGHDYQRFAQRLDAELDWSDIWSSRPATGRRTPGRSSADVPSSET